jgi:hypothetical protein
MMLLIIGGVCGLFFLIAWFYYKWAIGLFIVSLPIAYGISDQLYKFRIGPFPTTLIEIGFSALFIVWIIRYVREDARTLLNVFKKNKIFSWLGGIFLVSSIVSIWVSGDVIPALGIWRAYFLEPMVLFLIVVGRIFIPVTATPPSLPLVRRGNAISSPAGGLALPELSAKRRGVKGGGSKTTLQMIVWNLIISTVSISVYGIYQHIVGADAFSQGLGLPVLHRITSVFTSPNAVGLYVVPILMLLVGLVVERLKSGLKISKLRDYKIIILLIIGFFDIIALGLTKSEGAYVALGAGVAVMLFFIGYRKIAIALCVVAIVVGVSVPRIREAVLFHDPSGRVRLSLWQDSWNFLTESPVNFVFGAGLRQFQNKIQAPAQKYNFTKIERLLYPHTIVLNFWTETGLFGMLSFLGLVGYVAWMSFCVVKKDKVWGASLLGMIVVIVVHGLVDVPYFKNDLAILWWVLMGVVFLSYQFNIFVSNDDEVKNKVLELKMVK